MDDRAVREYADHFVLPAHAGMIPVMRVAKIETIADKDRTAELAKEIVELAEEKGCNLLELKIAAESVEKSTKAVLETKARDVYFFRSDLSSSS